ncbi:MAG: hypothetical protein AB9882_06400 [Ignavibacteriaceae bacterium]
MSLTALLFLALSWLSIVTGTVSVMGFVHYKVKKNIRQQFTKNSVTGVTSPRPLMNNYSPGNSGYNYGEINVQATNNPQMPHPTPPPNKNGSITELKKAKPLKMEVVNYYGPKDNNKRHYYGNK